MKRSWLYICLPPVLGLLVFLLVWRAGSVRVPTDAEINAAPSKSGRSPRLDPKRLEEALRRAGVGRNTSPETPTPTTRPGATSSSTESGGPYQEDLKKLRHEGDVRNHDAYIRGIVAGIIVTVVGYAVVGLMLRSQYKAKPTWKDALAAGRTPSTTDTEEG